MDRWTELVARIAATRSGVVLTSDLAAAGLQRDDLRAATRGLFRLRRGAYCLQPPADRREHHGSAARAVLAQHPIGVALSHTSAAAFHQFPVSDRRMDRIHITDREARVRPGLRHGVHSHRGGLEPDEVVLVDGVPVTAALRTVVDCLRQLPVEEALILADYALHRAVVSSAQLREQVAALAGMPGVSGARRVAQAADDRSESPGETRTRLILLQAGWDIEPQAVIRQSNGRFLARVDFLLTGTPIVVEFDGRAKYGMAGDLEAAHWREKQRQDGLNDAGYLVVRLVWRDLQDPGEVVRRVNAAVSRARRLGLTG